MTTMTFPPDVPQELAAAIIHNLETADPETLAAAKLAVEEGKLVQPDGSLGIRSSTFAAIGALGVCGYFETDSGRKLMATMGATMRAWAEPPVPVQTLRYRIAKVTEKAGEAASGAAGRTWEFLKRRDVQIVAAVVVGGAIVYLYRKELGGLCCRLQGRQVSRPGEAVAPGVPVLAALARRSKLGPDLAQVAADIKRDEAGKAAAGALAQSGAAFYRRMLAAKAAKAAARAGCSQGRRDAPGGINARSRSFVNHP